MILEDTNLYLFKKKDMDFIDIKKHLDILLNMNQKSKTKQILFSISQHDKPCWILDVE